MITPTIEAVSATLDNAGLVQTLSATSAGNVTTTIAQDISYSATGQVLSQLLGLSLLNQSFDSAGRINYIAGLDTTSGGTTGGGTSASTDVPLPPWSIILMGLGMMGVMQRHQQRKTSTTNKLAKYSSFVLVASLVTAIAYSAPSIAADLTINYDANGNPNTKTTPLGTTTYTYDALDRIKTEAGNTGNYTHSFDTNDNRISNGAGAGAAALISATYTANTDRIGTVNGQTITLDANGNTLFDGTYRYTWDAQNQLKTLSKADNTLLATYYYDELSLRTRKVTTTAAAQGASTMFYHYDQQGHLIAETGAATLAQAQTPQMTYVWNADILTGIIVHQPQRVVYTVQVDHSAVRFKYVPWQVKWSGVG